MTSRKNAEKIEQTTNSEFIRDEQSDKIYEIEEIDSEIFGNDRISDGDNDANIKKKTTCCRRVCMMMEQVHMKN
jgi:hypothetical protein